MSSSNEGKPYSIAFELRPGYLYVHVRGDGDSYEISKAYWTEVSAECAKHGAQRLLVYEDLAHQIESVSEVYKGAAERSYMGLSGVKIAFVDRHEDHHELNLFGELVASNRGLFCKVFYDQAEGERWLLSE
jgi:hypothetical protein